MTHPLPHVHRIPRVVLVAALAPALLVLGGCHSDAQTGALIGAGVGALGGYVIGNELDKDDHHHHHGGRSHYRHAPADRSTRYYRY